MGLQKIQNDLEKLLNHKDNTTAKGYIKNGDWQGLLLLIDECIDDANVDAVIASEEDNGQLMKEKTEILSKLMDLKFAIEDYVEEYVEEEEY